ncbi:MAG: hypothetical protein HY319_30400 [Armatimonadetes bacterium]|nr:hypothetical protein [Armatimonadota bacterium]
MKKIGLAVGIAAAILLLVAGYRYPAAHSPANSVSLGRAEFEATVAEVLPSGFLIVETGEGTRALVSPAAEVSPLSAGQVADISDEGARKSGARAAAGQSPSSELEGVGEGERVQVVLADTVGAIVAVENGLLTVSSAGGIVQIPLSAVPQRRLGDIHLRGQGFNGSLDRLLRRQGFRYLAPRIAARASVPDRSGVVAATLDGGLLVAVPAGRKIGLARLASFSAGDSIRLKPSAEGALALEPEPGTEAGFLTLDPLELEGEILQALSEAVVLETRQGRHLLIPSRVEFRSLEGRPIRAGRLEPGDRVVARIPAARGEIVGLSEEVVTVQTELGVLHVPREHVSAVLKEGAGVLAPSVHAEYLTLDEVSLQEPLGARAIIVERRNDLILATLVGGKPQLVRVAVDRLSLQGDLRSDDLETGAAVVLEGARTVDGPAELHEWSLVTR